MANKLHSSILHALRFQLMHLRKVCVYAYIQVTKFVNACSEKNSQFASNGHSQLKTGPTILHSALCYPTPPMLYIGMQC